MPVRCGEQTARRRPSQLPWAAQRAASASGSRKPEKICSSSGLAATAGTSARAAGDHPAIGLQHVAPQQPGQAVGMFFRRLPDSPDLGRAAVPGSSSLTRAMMKGRRSCQRPRKTWKVAVIEDAGGGSGAWRPETPPGPGRNRTVVGGAVGAELLLDQRQIGLPAPLVRPERGPLQRIDRDEVGEGRRRPSRARSPRRPRPDRAAGLRPVGPQRSDTGRPAGRARDESTWRHADPRPVAAARPFPRCR